MSENETTIHPTHTCFDDTVEIMSKIIAKHPETLQTDEFVIIHAIVAPHGKPFSHAWVESREGYAFWFGIIMGKRELLASTIEDYRAEHKVQAFTRYTFMQAYAQEKQTGRCGPWEPRYIALCNDGLPDLIEQ